MKLIELEEVDSTNDYLKREYKNSCKKKGQKVKDTF
jgi:hypothetical protein